MGMDLERKVYKCAPEYFIAGAEISVGKAVKVAGAVIPAHAPVAIGEDGKLATVTAANMDSLYGLLPEAAAADKEAVVYLTGEFFADSLALEEGVTITDIEVPLRNLGIFLK